MRERRTRLILPLCALAFAVTLSGCSVISFFSLRNNAVETTAIWFSDNTDGINKEATEAPVNFMGSDWTVAVPWESSYKPVRDNSEKDNNLISVYNQIESDYNVNIKIRTTQGLSDYLTASFSGVSYADVIGIRSYELVPLAVSGSIYSVEDPVVLAAGFNYKDGTRWYNDVSELAKWNGRQWAVQLSSVYETPDFGSFILYNKELLARLEPSGVTNIVRNGGWTNEKYRELAVLALKDVNRDGITDIYGTLMPDMTIPLLANQGQLVSEQDGYYKSLIKSADAIRAIGALSDLGLTQVFNGTIDEAVSLFYEGKAAFLWASSTVLSQYPELMETSGGFGILPLPNNAGSGFVAPVCGYNGYGFMTANTELGKSVKVFNRLACKFNQDLLSAYKLKFRLDADSQEMLDIIYQNKVFNRASYDGAISAVICEYVFKPVTQAGANAEEIINNAAPALDTVIIQRNGENRVGGIGAR